jgi:hypothetical protein
VVGWLRTKWIREDNFALLGRCEMSSSILLVGIQLDFVDLLPRLDVVDSSLKCCSTGDTRATLILAGVIGIICALGECLLMSCYLEWKEITSELRC